MPDRMTDALFDLLARIVARMNVLRREGSEAPAPLLALAAPPVPPEDVLSIPVCESGNYCGGACPYQ